MPVDRRVFWQVVCHQNSHTVAFNCLNRRAGRAAVITPALRGHTRGELVINFFGREVKLLHAIFHHKGQRHAIQSMHGYIALSRRSWRCLRCAGWFLRGGLSADQRRSQTRRHARQRRPEKIPARWVHGVAPVAGAVVSTAMPPMASASSARASQ